MPPAEAVNKNHISRCEYFDYRKSSNKPPGAYLHQEIFTWGLNRGEGLFEGGGLLVRLKIDMGAYLDIRKFTCGLNRGGGGGGGGDVLKHGKLSTHYRIYK